MSAIFIIRQRDAVHVLSDAAHYKPDGTLVEIASKLRTFPGMAAVMGARGNMSVLDQYALAIEGTIRRFDLLVFAMPRLYEIVQAEIEKFSAPIHYELTLSGWSESRNRPEVYAITNSSHADWLSPGELTLVSDAELIGGSVSPSDDALSAAAFEPWEFGDPETFDPVRHGLPTMEAMRRTPSPAFFSGTAEGVTGYFIGGFCELATVTRQGVDKRVLRRWPDKIGTEVDPWSTSAERRASALEPTAASEVA